MRRLLVPLALAAFLLAGCSDPPATPADDVVSPPVAAPDHVLDGTLEPAGLDAPTFRLAGALGRGGPVYGAGEPSAWAALDGSLYVAFPGCDRGFYLVPLPAPGQEPCEHGLVYRSLDDGATWERLNRDGDGRYADEGPEANGDADVAVDAAGTLYAANLGSDNGQSVITVHALDAAGWRYAGSVVPEGHWADRQWIAAGAAGHVTVAWMGGESQQQRAAAVTTSHDGGATWGEVQYLGDSIGWIGPVQHAPDGGALYVPFTQNEGGNGPQAVFYGSDEFSLRVGRSLDGGATWEDLDTGVRIVTNFQGGHWSGVNMAPTLDVTGDGSVVVAWSEDRNDPTATTSMGAVVKVVASRDQGLTWSQPVEVTDEAAAIQPWVTGGAGDRFAVVYYASPVPLDPDYTGGRWDARAVVVDGLDAGAGRVAATIEEGIHEGAICSRGGACLLTGSDRALLDFFEADLTADGRLFVAYPADPLAGGKHIDIRVAVQDGGTPLLERAGAEGTHVHPAQGS